MIKILITNTDTGIDTLTKYDKSFFYDNQAERIGQELHDLVKSTEMTEYDESKWGNRVKEDIPGFENTLSDLEKININKDREFQEFHK